MRPVTFPRSIRADAADSATTMDKPSAIAPPRSAPPPGWLAFLHVPKAGGTTLRSIIRRQYPVDGIRDVSAAADVPTDAPERVRVLQGHFAYGIHDHAPVPLDYVTMLRDPVDRVTSLYFYWRNRPDHPLYGWTRGITLAEFASSGHPETVNHQCRLLSGRLDDFGDETLAAAVEHLTARFACFGLHERFDESVTLMRRRFGWRSAHYRRENVTVARPAVRELTAHEVGRIRDANRLDLELLEVARERFAETIARQPRDFHADLRRLVRINRVYGALAGGLRVVAGVAPAPARRWVRGAVDAMRARRDR